MAVDFGRYKLLRRLAYGGMAEIFIAEIQGPEGFAKTVVVKRILPHLATEERFVEMFVDEAKLAATLSHPNIAQVYELGQINGSYFIAMEYVKGTDLSKLLRALHSHQERMPLEAAVAITIRALRGLHHAHTQTDSAGAPLQIVHRDVSPNNLLLSLEGQVKVTDFGIAKAASSSTKTRTGFLKGKCSYMSPEQAQGLPLDGRSDLFAVGIILYEMLTAKRLYQAQDELATLELARRADIPPVHTVNPDMPLALSQVLQKALAKSPDDRYKDCAEMGAALRGLAEEMRIAEDEDIAALVKKGLQYAPPPVAEPLAEDLSDDIMTTPHGKVGSKGDPGKPLPVALILSAVFVLVALVTGGVLVFMYRDARTQPVVTAPPPPASQPVAAPAPPPSTPSPEPAAAHGFLTLNSDPWANVSVDGTKLGKTTPIKRLRLSPGQHRIKLDSPPAKRSREIVVDIEAGKNTTRIVDFSKK